MIPMTVSSSPGSEGDAGGRGGDSKKGEGRGRGRKRKGGIAFWAVSSED